MNMEMNRNKKNITGTSGFLNVFGNSDKAKVLDFFIENKIFGYNVEETHKATGISKEKLKKIFSLFFKIGILAWVYSDKGQFYTLAENDLVKYLLMFDNRITRFNVDLIELEQKKELV